MTKILYAPLQGFTDATYRVLHNKYFGGIDEYYAPYLRFETTKDPKKAVLKDMLPENNKGINLIPQLLGNDPSLFIEHTKRLQDDGYKTINWNLACPYPMVHKRGFGSGLLKTPELLHELLSEIIPKIELPLSLKCRLGFESKNEIHTLINTFNDFDLKEIIIHARTAKQLYKGRASMEYFNKALLESKNSLIYNGDIKSVTDFEKLNTIIDTKPRKLMIGRGLLENPFLANEINNITIEKEEKTNTLREFHDEIFENYNSKLEKSHILKKMQTFWEYFSYTFEEQHKVNKKIKKTSNIHKYHEMVDEVFNGFAVKK